MFNAKYIVSDSDVIIFPAYFDHVETCRNVFGGRKDVKGAGFVKFRGDGSVECFGRSDSLDVDSRGEEDAVLVRIMCRLNNDDERGMKNEHKL